MISYPVQYVDEEFKKITGEEIDKVKMRNLRLVDLYKKSKELILRVFEAGYLTYTIWEARLTNRENLVSFKPLLEFLSNSKICEIDQEVQAQGALKTKKFISLVTGLVRQTPIIPKQHLLRLKTEPEPFSSVEFVNTMINHFNLKEDYLLLSEISTNEIITYNLEMESIRLEIKQALVDFRRLNIRDVSKNCYLDQISSELFAKVFKEALNIQTRKIFMVLKETEYLLKYMQGFISDRKETSIHFKLDMSQYSASQIMDSQLNQSWRAGESPHKPTQKPKRGFESHYAAKYPEASTYNHKLHESLGKKLIPPFRRAMELAFNPDIKKEADQDVFGKALETSEPSQEDKIEQLEGIDRVKQLISEEKNREMLTTVKVSKRKLNKSSQSLPKENNLPTNLWAKKDSVNNDLKEIMRFGTTLRAIKKCLAKQTKESNLITKMPSIMEAKLPGAMRSQRRKLLNLIQQSPNVGGTPVLSKAQMEMASLIFTDNNRPRAKLDTGGNLPTSNLLIKKRSEPFIKSNLKALKLSLDQSSDSIYLSPQDMPQSSSKSPKSPLKAFSYVRPGGSRTLNRATVQSTARISIKPRPDPSDPTGTGKSPFSTRRPSDYLSPSSPIKSFQSANSAKSKSPGQSFQRGPFRISDTSYTRTGREMSSDSFYAQKIYSPGRKSLRYNQISTPQKSFKKLNNYFNASANKPHPNFEAKRFSAISHRS